ncbi:hypothetical protein HDU87_000653 [Geranomyces variabilis]|uniref:Uncharacterized protein n=1 Tax=Geranomyces variabilis TaxID=109894 RepID=A0AAD5TEB0_9FUNG|nr:hypothetical protein HDU87_000653 [Geranomyces variabilis]
MASPPHGLHRVPHRDKVMAVATNGVIRTYDPQTKDMLAELRGHLGNMKSLRFLSSVVQDSDKETRLSATKYILLSGSSGIRGREDTIVLWRLNSQGQQVDSRLPMNLEQLTSCALDGICNDLRSQHGLEDLAIEASRMRPAHQLPQVVLYSVHSQTEMDRLKGHKDARRHRRRVCELG